MNSYQTISIKKKKKKKILNHFSVTPSGCRLTRVGDQGTGIDECACSSL